MKWTATLVHTEATTAQNAASTYQGHSRTKAGEVAWLTESLRAAEWIKAQKTREQVYYGDINTKRTAVYTIAEQMADTAGYDVAANPAAETGLTAGNPGAAKALATALTARDASTNANPGSGYAVPAARTQSTSAGLEWETSWAATAASMTSWV